jgi:hypothetical protein
MPSVWWPWMCQLVVVETSSRGVVLDLVAIEPGRAGRTTIPAGTLFSVRIEPAAQSRPAELDTIYRWAQAGTEVTILAGRDGRSAWLCLSCYHQRVVLTDVRCDIDTRVLASERAPRGVQVDAGTNRASRDPREVRS